MRVAVDAFNLAHDKRGMGRHVRGILARLEFHGILPSLICRTESDAERLRPVCEGARILGLQAARRERFEAAWFPWNGMRFDLNVRSVVTIHDLFAIEEPHRNLVARFRETRPILRALRKAAAIATVSRWTASRIEGRYGHATRAMTLVPPVLEAFWQPVTRPAGDQPGPYVLFVGGPEPRKNAALLFDAFERAFPRNSVRLIVAGTLNALDEQQLRSKGFAHDRVHPDDAELRDLYSNALAVAVPSLLEGYGLVALEAMACGAAVLASDAAALPEACDGAAHLVEADNVLAWAAALGRVAQDQDLREELQKRSLQRTRRIDRDAPARTMAELFLALR